MNATAQTKYDGEELESSLSMRHPRVKCSTKHAVSNGLATDEHGGDIVLDDPFWLRCHANQVGRRD